MQINKTKYEEIIQELIPKNVSVVAVSKTKTTEAIKQLYELGQRDFGENYVQELVDKQSVLPSDIRWHFIGHLQTNKAKYLTPFIHLIHGVDSFKLLKELNKQALKSQRIIKLLLQVHLAEEETKFGLDEHELSEIINSDELRELKNVEVVGLMGMASFTENKEQVRKEFRYLKSLFDKHANAQAANYKMQFLSMGMSSDYKIAIKEGSNLVRIGSLIFGERN
jgi:pyridoxal phosphate enzyme (YggS family)